MGVVLTSINREKLNRENYIWLYCRQYRENLDLRKFPAIRYYTSSLIPSPPSAEYYTSSLVPSPPPAEYYTSSLVPSPPPAEHFHGCYRNNEYHYQPPHNEYHH